MPINPAEISTIRVGELPIDEILLTSKFPIENDTTLYQATLQELINFININASALQYEVKELWVNQTYIDNNFDVTGYGINLMEGYAICNGNNGTPPMDGLVSVGYGTNYNVIGGFGGSANAVLIGHKHKSIEYSDGKNDVNPIGTGTTSTGFFNSSISNTNKINETSAFGIDNGTNFSPNEDGVGKNMQPYIILLKIMKL